MMGGKPFFGGVPTDAEIKMLREKYPDSAMKPHYFIPYEEIERVVGCSRRSFRWRTIIYRWINMLRRDHAIIIDCVRGRGFEVQDDSGILKMGTVRVRKGVRSVARGMKLTGYCERKELSEDEKRRYDFIAGRAAAILTAAQIRGRRGDLPKLT